MKVNTYSYRRVITGSDENNSKPIIQYYRIPVYKCSNCEKGHQYYVLLPDFIFPYKQYSTEIIRKAVFSESGADDCEAESSTIASWKRWFLENKILIYMVKDFLKSKTHPNETYFPSSKETDMHFDKVLSILYCLGALFNVSGFRKAYIYCQRE